MYELKIKNGSEFVDVICETKNLIIHRPIETTGTLSRHYVLTLKNVNTSIGLNKRELKDLRICSINNMSVSVCHEIITKFENTNAEPSNSTDYINEIKLRARVLQSLSGSKDYRELFLTFDDDQTHNSNPKAGVK